MLLTSSLLYEKVNAKKLKNNLYNSVIIEWKPCDGQVTGRGCPAPLASLGILRSLILHLLTNLEAL